MILTFLLKFTFLILQFYFLQLGISYAEKDRLVTFGIVPKSPETGYGYIKAEKPINLEHIEGAPIEKFFDKPDFDTAKRFVLD